MTCVYQAPAGEMRLAREAAARWEGPDGHTLISWEEDFRAGGCSRLRVRSPDGIEHWIESVRLEIAEPERVVFSGDFGFAEGAVTFRRTEGSER